MNQCPDCGREISPVNSRCEGCGKYFPPKAEAPAAGGSPDPAPAGPSGQWSDLKNLLFIGSGSVVFIFLTLALYRAVPRQALPPAGQASGAAAGPGSLPAPAPVQTALPVPADSPAPSAMAPLTRSLEKIEELHGKAIEPVGKTPITAGPLEGGTLKTYHTGSAVDELSVKDGKLYKRSLSFDIAGIGAGVESFCSAVYLLALYSAAYDLDYTQASAPAELKARADEFGAKCAALGDGPGRSSEQYMAAGAYVFGCVNEGNKRLKYETMSEGLFKAEKTTVETIPRP